MKDRIGWLIVLSRLQANRDAIGRNLLLPQRMQQSRGFSGRGTRQTVVPVSKGLANRSVRCVQFLDLSFYPKQDLFARSTHLLARRTAGVGGAQEGRNFLQAESKPQGIANEPNASSRCRRILPVPTAGAPDLSEQPESFVVAQCVRTDSHLSCQFANAKSHALSLNLGVVPRSSLNFRLTLEAIPTRTISHPHSVSKKGTGS